MTRDFAQLGDNAREEKKAAEAAQARLTKKVRERELEQEKDRLVRMWQQQLTSELARTLGAEATDEEFVSLQWHVDDATDDARVKLGLPIGAHVRMRTTFQGVQIWCQCSTAAGPVLGQGRGLFSVRSNTDKRTTKAFSSLADYGEALRFCGYR